MLRTTVKRNFLYYSMKLQNRRCGGLSSLIDIIPTSHNISNRLHTPRECCFRFLEQPKAAASAATLGLQDPRKRILPLHCNYYVERAWPFHTNPDR